MFFINDCFKTAQPIETSSHAPPSPKIPKRPMSAFLLFSLDKRKEFPNMPLLESTQKLSIMWRNATDKEKEVCLV